MNKQIRLNALDMMCVGCTPGIWRHPRDRSEGYKTLDYWVDLARVLERGRFDSLFIADIFGIYDVFGGNSDAAFRHAVEFPVCDPMLTVPAMATATEHLGFGVTGTLSYEHPYSFARRVSTLDHLSGGRFAWNIVTGYLSSAARAFGMVDQLTHDERYDRGDEFMDVVYALWEGSWEDDAVVLDREKGLFADPEKIHEIVHRGRHFDLRGYHLCEPSPQRTPVLFQAGASTRGREFAARHAECVFVSGLTRSAVARTVADIRRRAAAHGRDPDSVVIYGGLCVVCAPTDAEAREKLEDYRAHVDVERSLTLFAGYAGVDFSGSDWDTPLRYFESNAIQSFVEGFTKADPDKQWTLREIGEFFGIGGFAPIEVGSPETLCDAMESWVEETGIDGFNLLYSVSPDDLVDFVDLVVPELQRRGIHKTEYAPGTLREKLYGPGQARLRDDHPGALHRVDGASRRASGIGA